MKNLAAFLNFIEISICLVVILSSKYDMILSISCSFLGLSTIDDKHLFPRYVLKLLFGIADTLFVPTVIQSCSLRHKSKIDLSNAAINFNFNRQKW